MKRNRHPSTARQDLADPTYLDHLGKESARRYGPIVIEQASRMGLRLPLPTAELTQLLENTIRGLEAEGKIKWNRLPQIRRQVFIVAWDREMSMQGIT